MYASVATSVIVMMLLMMNTSMNRRRKEVLCHSFDALDEKTHFPPDIFNDDDSTPICECSRRFGRFKDRACRKEVRQHSTDELREIIKILLEEISANGAIDNVAENVGELLNPNPGGLSAMLDSILKSAVNSTRHQPLIMPYWDFRMDLNTEMPQRTSVIERVSVAYGGSDDDGTALDRSFRQFSEMVLSLRSADSKWSHLSKIDTSLDAFGSVADETWQNRQRAFELTEHFIAQRSDNASVLGGRLLQIFFMVAVDNQIDANCSCVDFDESSCTSVSRWLQWDLSLERCVARLIPPLSSISLPRVIFSEVISKIDNKSNFDNKSGDVDRNILSDDADNSTFLNVKPTKIIMTMLPALLNDDLASSTPYTEALVSSSGELQLLSASNPPESEASRGYDNEVHEESDRKKTETTNSLAFIDNLDDQNPDVVSTTLFVPTVVDLNSSEDFDKSSFDLPIDVGILPLSVSNVVEISTPKPWSDNGPEDIDSSPLKVTTFSASEILPEKVETVTAPENAILDSLNSTPKSKELKTTTMKKHHRKHHKKFRHRHTQNKTNTFAVTGSPTIPRNMGTTTTLTIDNSPKSWIPTTVLPLSFDVAQPMATTDSELRKYNTFYEAPVRVSSPDSTDSITTTEPLTLDSLNSAEAVFVKEFDSLRPDEPRLRKGYGGDDLIINSGSKDYSLIVDPIGDRKSSYSEPQHPKSVDFESDGATSILAKNSRFLAKNSENKKIKHKDESNNLDLLLKYLTKPKLPKGTILWKLRRAPIPLVYFTITLINGPLSRRRRPPPSNKRRVRGARIYVTGLNMPTGYTQVTEGIQMKGDNAALVRTLNPQTTGPFVEFKIRVENKYGAVCKQMCLDASQRYRRCARRSVRLSTYKRFSDPIPFYQSSTEALDSQWTGKGYYRRRKYDYLLFRCEE